MAALAILISYVWGNRRILIIERWSSLLRSGGDLINFYLNPCSVQTAVFELTPELTWLEKWHPASDRKLTLTLYLWAGTCLPIIKNDRKDCKASCLFYSQLLPSYHTLYSACYRVSTHTQWRLLSCWEDRCNEANDSWLMCFFNSLAAHLSVDNFLHRCCWRWAWNVFAWQASRERLSKPQAILQSHKRKIFHTVKLIFGWCYIWCCSRNQPHDAWSVWWHALFWDTTLVLKAVPEREWWIIVFPMETDSGCWVNNPLASLSQL